MRNIPKDLFPYKKDALSSKEIAVVKAVLDKYGSMTGDELSEKTHSEQPWIVARKNIPEDQNSNRNVKEIVMYDYYLTSGEDYEDMEDRMLFHQASEREKENSHTVSFKNALKMLGINEEELL